MSAMPGAANSCRPRPTSPRPSRRSRPTARKPPTARNWPTNGRSGSARWRTRACRFTTSIGRRRIVIEKPSGSKNEALRVGLADGRILPLSARWLDPRKAQALRCRPRQSERRQPEGQDCRARRDADAAERAGHRGGAGEQDRPHFRDGRRLLLSAEPAQSRHAGAAPARFLDQAAELSRGAAAACSPTPMSATIRSRLPPIGSSGSVLASRTTGRRRTTTAAMAAP